MPTLQRVVQDGQTRLSDGGAGTYNNTANSSFALGGWAKATGGTHNGRVFEGLFYQTALNHAQRRIINSYLSAKWNKNLSTTATYADVYTGDNPANGNYDYFVGGIGQHNGTQTTGTSQGLTITDNSFLNANGKFVMTGVNYLVTTPQTGTSTNDLPNSNYFDRSNRSWYIDTTGNGGLVNLSFNASSIGIPVNNGKTYGLLHRTATSGVFTEVATVTMAGGIISFSHLPADGVYTVGKLGIVKFSLQKTSMTAQDPVNITSNPKAIPGALIDYTLTVKNTGDGYADLDQTIISDTIPDKLTLFTGNLDGGGNPFIFNDNYCPPTASTLSSNLTLNYPANVIFKNSAGTTTSPASDFDTAIRSFEITMSGAMNASLTSDIPCFTISYRTKLN